MRRHLLLRSLVLPLAFLVPAAGWLAGCATTGEVPASSAAGEGRASAVAKLFRDSAELPKEVPVELRLSAGDAWKSRYVATSETRRTLRGPDGKSTVKTRSVGMEVVAVQKVLEVRGTVARIEIAEEDVRILQDGKFIPAPYKQFNPPNPVTFTLDTATGKADFSKVRQAYGMWMSEVKEGPVGDVLGKTFRLPGYLAVIEDLYVKPFTRVGGRKLAREASSSRDVVLPFLGHGAGSVAIPVESSLRYTGFSTPGGRHLLAVEGRYEGRTSLDSREDLEARLAEFGGTLSSQFTGFGEASGQFASSVDVASGREQRSVNRVTYNAEWAFGGMKLMEEILGKSTLEPMD